MFQGVYDWRQVAKIRSGWRHVAKGFRCKVCCKAFMVKACCITVLERKYVAKVFWGWRQLLLSFRIKGYVEMGFYAKGMSLWLHVANHIRLIAIWCKWFLRLKTCCKGFYGWRHVLGYFVSNTCVFTQLREKTMHNAMWRAL